LVFGSSSEDDAALVGEGVAGRKLGEVCRELVKLEGEEEQ